MPAVEVEVECPVHDSFRVQQVAGLFDVPLAERSVEWFEVELPGDDEEWSVGLIVGPSGSGKSTVARERFGNCLYEAGDWPTDRAVIDCFGELSVKRVVELFTAVGFGSPPSWVKPYHVLSNGERFRCDLARSLAVGIEAEDAGRAEPAVTPVVAFDEFTSVVDRNVARVCSAAIAKGVRKGRIPCRFVAVTCHYDVAEWLEADWVLDMSTGRLTRRRLRRPDVRLEVHRCGVAAWRLFARHHYLTGTIATAARCYLATWDGMPVSFAATLPVIAKPRHRRFTRIVTLPDYQGIGIGMRTVAAVAELHREEGLRINVTSSHPALINHCRASPLWRAVNVNKTGQGSRRHRTAFRLYRSSAGRAVVSFEYVGREARGSRLEG
ncbi:MAG: GNAT family N-acetyltransferase [Planctomycetota bacterium]